MLMIIMNVCKVKYPKWLTYVLFGVSAVVFVIAASQGYTDWYYADVSIEFVNGAAKLVKDYGPLHNVYYIYLLAYFVIMAGVIVFAYVRKHVFNWKLAALLLCSVFGNIMIWLVEQLIRGDFEFLSISYIITELFMLFLYGLLQDHDIINDLGINQKVFELMQDDYINVDKLVELNPELKELTTREMEVLIPLLEDKKRKEIADELHVTEHTIKKHTAHIFAKLEVSNRKELHEKLHIK
jgi:DNA-binding CsgD family transcriptional regulator